MANKPKTVTVPAAIDIHVHFREPGDNKAETIASGSRAAALGGYGLVCDMPNNPGSPIWTLERLNQKQAIIEKSSVIPIATYAGSQPDSNNREELAEMAKKCIGLKLYGAATTGNHVDYDPQDFDEIVATWHKVAPNKPIMLHSGRDNLDKFIELIAGKHSHKLHVCHIFNPEQVEHVKKAKADGLSVTCGVCPHHIFKTSHHASTEGWFARMQPPLLEQSGAEKLFELLASGDIDIIETDHAPHSAESKWSAEQENPEAIHDKDHKTCFGVPGIEFALPLLFYQMNRGRISLERIIDATSKIPARIVGIKLDPKTKVTWDLSEYRIGEKYPKGISGSSWTPYLNNIGAGTVLESIIGGKQIIKNGEIVSELPRVTNTGETV